MSWLLYYCDTAAANLNFKQKCFAFQFYLKFFSQSFNKYFSYFLPLVLMAAEFEPLNLGLWFDFSTTVLLWMANINAKFAFFAFKYCLKFLVNPLIDIFPFSSLWC